MVPMSCDTQKAVMSTDEEEHACSRSAHLPVAVEQVRLHLQHLGRVGDDLAAKVVGLRVRLVQQLQQDLLLEDVDAHARNVRHLRRLEGPMSEADSVTLRQATPRLLLGEAQDGGVNCPCLERLALGLLGKADDAAGGVDLKA